MDITAVINQMLVLLTLMLVGYICGRTGLIDKASNKSLSSIVLNVAQSAMILSAVMNVKPELSGLELLEIVGVSFLTYVILIAASCAVPPLLRVKGPGKGLYQLLCIFPNVGFMGFPIVRVMYGDAAVFYASLCNIPFNILAYSVGIAMMTQGQNREKFNWRIMINAPLISTAIALLIFLLRIPIPAPLAEATGLLGDMVVPAAMLVIGSSLGRIPMRQLFGGWRVYAVLPIKLIAAPVLIWAILRLFIHNSLILGMSTILVAMPTAAVATILSIQYGGDEDTASRGVFLTTIASVVTIPLIAYLLIL